MKRVIPCEAPEDWESALRHHRDRFELDMAGRDGHRAIGRCGRIADALWHLGRIEQSLSWHRRAVEIAEARDPDGTAYHAWREHLELGDALMRAGRREAALRSYAAAVDSWSIVGAVGVSNWSELDAMSRLTKQLHIGGACACLDRHALCLLEFGRLDDAGFAARRQLELATPAVGGVPSELTAFVVRAARCVMRVSMVIREFGTATAMLSTHADLAEEVARGDAVGRWRLEICAEFWEAACELHQAKGDVAARDEARRRAHRLRARIEEFPETGLR